MCVLPPPSLLCTSMAGATLDATLSCCTTRRQAREGCRQLTPENRLDMGACCFHATDVLMKLRPELGRERQLPHATQDLQYCGFFAVIMIAQYKESRFEIGAHLPELLHVPCFFMLNRMCPHVYPHARGGEKFPHQPSTPNQSTSMCHTCWQLAAGAHRMPCVTMRVIRCEAGFFISKISYD